MVPDQFYWKNISILPATPDWYARVMTHTVSIIAGFTEADR